MPSRESQGGPLRKPLWRADLLLDLEGHTEVLWGRELLEVGSTDSKEAWVFVWAPPLMGCVTWGKPCPSPILTFPPSTDDGVGPG